MDLEQFNESLSYKVEVRHTSDTELTVIYPKNIFLDLEEDILEYILEIDNNYGIVIKSLNEQISRETYPCEVVRLAIMYDAMCFGSLRNINKQLIHHYDKNEKFVQTGGFDNVLNDFIKHKKMDLEEKIYELMKYKLDNWLEDIQPDEKGYYALVKLISNGGI